MRVNWKLFCISVVFSVSQSYALNISQNHFGYTGQHSNVFGGFRQYNPKHARFAETDTYNTFNKKSVNNLFAYVKENPLKFSDPSGHVFGSDKMAELSAMNYEQLGNHLHELRRRRVATVNELKEVTAMSEGAVPQTMSSDMKKKFMALHNAHIAHLLEQSKHKDIRKLNFDHLKQMSVQEQTAYFEGIMDAVKGGTLTVDEDSRKAIVEHRSLSLRSSLLSNEIVDLNMEIVFVERERKTQLGEVNGNTTGGSSDGSLPGHWSDSEE